MLGILLTVFKSINFIVMSPAHLLDEKADIEWPGTLSKVTQLTSGEGI